MSNLRELTSEELDFVSGGLTRPTAPEPRPLKAPRPQPIILIVETLKITTNASSGAKLCRLQGPVARGCQLPSVSDRFCGEDNNGSVTSNADYLRRGDCGAVVLIAGCRALSPRRHQHPFSDDKGFKRSRRPRFALQGAGKGYP